MYQPYCYLLKCPNGKVYYGSAYSVKRGAHPEEFWQKYFTTSKVIHALIEEYGSDKFEFEIRKTFDNAKECHDWETKVLHRMNVIYDDRFINQSNNVNFGANITPHPWTPISRQRASEVKKGEKNGMFGKKHTDESRAKMKRKESDETRQKKIISQRKRREREKLKKENALY